MEEGAGEHLVLGFHGLELPDWVRELEARFGLGGVILFDRDLLGGTPTRNVESPDQLHALCTEVHSLPSRPLVFVDQEGGRVTRLKQERGFLPLPSAGDLCSMDPGAAWEVTRASYAEMGGLGIDFNLAPVIDLDLYPDNPNIGALGRSFSADPDEVRRCAELCARAAGEAGLQLCLKHFPGLGAATTDSHELRTELEPVADQLALFEALVARVPGAAILMSHGVVEAWDAEGPVSLSAAAVGAARRADPGVLLVTDDLQMGGLQAFCPTVEGGLRAVEAGVDLVCIGNQMRDERDACFELAEALGRAPFRDGAAPRAARARVRERKDRAGSARS